MSVKQNHHYLPQSYQRGWANNLVRQPYVYEWRHDRVVCAPKSTKSTGARDGLYFVPMAPSGDENKMEDVFWKKNRSMGSGRPLIIEEQKPILRPSSKSRTPRNICDIVPISQSQKDFRIRSACKRTCQNELFEG